MTATYLAPYPVQKFFDNNGAPLSYGLVYTYEAGSTTPIATFTDSTGDTENPNPIVLNFRGECPIWLTPNTGYKINVTDESGNQIPGYPVDQIYNNLLLTLFAGVDTGIANAYIVNYNAPFTAYGNGIVIYFVASNTNTGASTIDVNGLGVVNIVNANGTALSSGQILTGTMTQIVYFNGVFILTSFGAASGNGIGTFGPEIAIASASTTDIGSTGSHTIAISGSATINSLGNSASLDAPIFCIRFTSGPVLVQSSTLITPSGANITVNPGDACIAEYLGSATWKILIYQSTAFASGFAVKAAPTSRASTTSITNDPNLTLTLTTGTYVITGWLNDLGGTSSGGLAGAFAYSGTSSNAEWSMAGIGGGITNVTLTAISVSPSPVEMQSAQSGTASMSINGFVQATSPGVLSFQWAQNSSAVGASLVGPGSWLEATLLTPATGSFSPIEHAYSIAGSGTETIPTGASSMTVEIWGGSGQGGVFTGGIGSGGGSGGYSRTVTSVSGDGGETMSYVVGAAGAPGSGALSEVVAGSFAITTMIAGGGTEAAGLTPGTGGSATGGNAVNTSGNDGQAGGSSGGAGGAGIVGINGTGNPGGNGVSFIPVRPGGAGLIIFKYQ